MAGSKAIEAVEFFLDYQGDYNGGPTGYRKDFADDKPCKSILQRAKQPLKDVLEMFDWSDDNDGWIEEYNKNDGPDLEKLVRYKRRACFLIGCWREFNEDFGRGDVSCLRDIRTPLVTSRTPLKTMRDEFDEK